MKSTFLVLAIVLGLMSVTLALGQTVAVIYTFWGTIELLPGVPGNSHGLGLVGALFSLSITADANASPFPPTGSPTQERFPILSATLTITGSRLSLLWRSCRKWRNRILTGEGVRKCLYEKLCGSIMEFGGLLLQREEINNQPSADNAGVIEQVSDLCSFFGIETETVSECVCLNV